MIMMEKENKILSIQLITIVVSAILIATFLLTPSLFEFTWNQALRDLLPGTQDFFRYITELGGTLTYLCIFFIIFWGIDKRFGKSLLFIYVANNFTNYYAKSIIANPRPDESKWILISAGHLSTPSGHAMSSSVFWGYSAMKIKKWSIWIINILIIVLIGLSRMYLGVHWFGDILTGWLFGIIILTITWIFEEPLNSFLSKHDVVYIYLGLAFFGFIVMILTQILYPISNLYDFGTEGGQMIGLGIGFALEHKFVNFDIHFDAGKKWKLILRILIGLLVFSFLFLGLYLVIDTSIFWLNALHYSITLIVGIFLWPLIFKKIAL